ncbi:hypothetical protein ACFSHQ_07815 [Gemmobacter lanyuensis]
MAADRQLHLYLPAHLRRDQLAGQVNILARLIEALPDWQLHHHPEAEGAARRRAPDSP